MRLFPIALFISCCFMVACSPQSSKETASDDVEEVVIDDHIYHSEATGWTMEIPEGWTVMKRNDLNQKMEKGKEVLEDVIGEEYDYSALEFLVNFQKDEFNMFQSTAEPYDETTRGDWEANNAQLKGVIYDAYTNQGILIDTTETTTENIAGLDFKRFDVALFDPNGKVILNQIMYTRLINGREVAININYNNVGFREEMISAWKKSTFAQ